MFCFPRAAAFLCVFMLSASCFAWQSAPAPKRSACTVDNDPITPTERLLFRSDFASAESSAHAELAAHPESPEANEFYVRALIGLDRVEDAVTQAKTFASAHPDFALAQAALAEADLRAAHIDDARAAISTAHKLNPCEPRHQLVGGRLFEMGGYHKTSAQWFALAHRLRPLDEEAYYEWVSALPRAQRAEELAKRLGQANNISAAQRDAESKYIQSLLAPAHACRATTKKPRTEIPITFFVRPGTRSQFGLTVKLNGKDRILKIDSGASGISLSFGAAKRLNLIPEEEFEMIGVGQQGFAKSFRTHVDRITIGDLELSDCIIDVYQTPNDLGSEDGLIGTDTFRNFLITFDFMDKHQLILEPLPARPNTTASQSLPVSASTAPDADEERFDKYVDPSMKDWDDIFRSGAHLLLPTHLNNGPTRMLVADTGADISLLTPPAARATGKISREYQTNLVGLNGRVDELYKIDDVELTFNRFRVPKRRYLVSDLTALSHNAGVEISGLLGFEFLQLLDLQIDYRDNLIRLNRTHREFTPTYLR